MSERKRNVVLFDLDHTVSDAVWRDDCLPKLHGSMSWDQINAAWDEYHSGLQFDRPCSDMVGLANALYATAYNVIGLTARPERWRAVTNGWLMEHNVMIEDVLMRPDDDFSPAPECKMKLVEGRFGKDFHEVVAMLFDDRDDIVELFRGRGVTCLRVSARREERK